MELQRPTTCREGHAREVITDGADDSQLSVKAMIDRVIADDQRTHHGVSFPAYDHTHRVFRVVSIH
ncbi:hypothetical protein D3C84_1083140 [compost metagenome]